MVRLGLKARCEDFRAFDRRIDREFFSASAGVAASDIAWRVSCEGEAAGRAEQHFGLIAWGLKSMYDMLGHHRLRRKAVALNMPRELAVVTLASYRWPRLISTG